MNHKRLESGNKNPPPRRVRNRQFTYIHGQRQRFTAKANPIISVDAKKKEWIGKSKNPGACWEQQPQLVNDHDFPSDAKGRAIPYGIYDPGLNRGFMVVGSRSQNAGLCGRRHCSMVEELRTEAIPRSQGTVNLGGRRAGATVRGPAAGNTTYNSNS